MNILIDKLNSEIPNWKNVISSIEREDSSGSRSLREGEREVFLELKEFWKYNDFNPNRAKDLINELKKMNLIMLRNGMNWGSLEEFAFNITPKIKRLSNLFREIWEEEYQVTNPIIAKIQIMRIKLPKFFQVEMAYPCLVFYL